MKVVERDKQHYESITPDTTTQTHYELSVKDKSYVPMHWHNALEYISILEGELTVELDGRKIELHAGDLMIFNPNELHATTSLTGNTAVLIQVPSDPLGKAFQLNLNRQIVYHPHTKNAEKRAVIDEIRALMFEMKELEEKRPYGWIIQFEYRNLQIIYKIYATFSQPLSDAELRGNARNRERIAAVIAYTQEHYAEPISLDEAAELTHLQKNYFCRVFRNTVGLTYQNYLNELRLAMIYKDLLVSDNTLTDLLQKHGFTNYKLFRTMFNRRFGCTPGELRRQNKL